MPLTLLILDLLPNRAIGIRVLPGELERGLELRVHTQPPTTEQRISPPFLNSELSGASEFLPHSGTRNVVPMLTSWKEHEQPLAPVLNSQFQWRFLSLWMEGK